MPIQHILTVSDTNKYIKDMMTKDFILSNLWVKGEISNFKNHYSGHLYFTLKDEKSLIKCVMFRAQASMLKFSPEDGMKAIVRGSVSVYERDGQYQLYADEIQPDGMGSLYIAFEQLKKKLKQEGLFDESRKRSLPYMPASIGVVTSSQGAAVRDIINIISRRFRNINVRICPVQVQGDQAAGQIVLALELLNRLDNVEVIILARGGGSLEELWAFNEEIVARGIYKSRIPVISAVGHETDFTISDFVADVRAPTPSAAAELAVPERSMVENNLASLLARIRNAAARRIGTDRMLLGKLSNSVTFRRPYNRIFQERMRLDVQSRYMQKAYEKYIDAGSKGLAILTAKLDSLSPLSSLARGYSIVRSQKDNTLIKSVNGVDKGDRLEINVSDGRIECVVDIARKDK